MRALPCAVLPSANVQKLQLRLLQTLLMHARIALQAWLDRVVPALALHPLDCLPALLSSASACTTLHACMLVAAMSPQAHTTIGPGQGNVSLAVLACSHALHGDSAACKA